MGTCGNLWDLCACVVIHCGCFFTTFIRCRVFFLLQGVFLQRFFAARAFFHNVFKLQGVSPLRFYTAGCFYIAYFTPQGVFRCVFYTACRFCIACFHRKSFSRCVFYTAWCFYSACFRCRVFFFVVHLMLCREIRIEFIHEM